MLQDHVSSLGRTEGQEGPDSFPTSAFTNQSCPRRGITNPTPGEETTETSSGVYYFYIQKTWYQSSTSSAQLGSQFLSLCFFKLSNASHWFWTQDVTTPVTTDLQRKNRLDISYNLLIHHSVRLLNSSPCCTRGRAPSTTKSHRVKQGTTFQSRDTRG